MTVPENSVTGDNERQAEIEAVARALIEAVGDAAVVHLVADGPIRLIPDEWQRIVDRTIDLRGTLDRVRDARRDDEARCEVCADAPYPWNCERCNPSAARSPHETARLRHGLEAIASGDVDGVGDYSECVQLYARQILDSSSPSRDGTVAVEDVERLVEALRFYADPVRWRADGAIQSPGAHPLLESPAAFDKGHRARAALAEFGVSERIHNQATGEPNADGG